MKIKHPIHKQVHSLRNHRRGRNTQNLDFSIVPGCTAGLTVPPSVSCTSVS